MKSSSEELKLFITEAKRLTSKSFYQHFSAEEVVFSSIDSAENTPNIEQLESYLLHFRKFIQKNDRVCIHNINHLVSDLAKKHNVLLAEWDRLYTDFQGLLESQALTGRVITHVSEIPDLSLLEIFRIRTFGDLSHLNPGKQVLHQKLSSTNQLNALYRFEYYNFLFEVGEIIAEMAEFCTILLKHLHENR